MNDRVTHCLDMVISFSIGGVVGFFVCIIVEHWFNFIV